MKKCYGLVAALMVVSFAVSGNAQEYPDDSEEFDEPLMSEVIEESEFSESNMDAIANTYVILYNRKNFGGFARRVNLRDGARIDLHRCNKLHDNVRSLKIFGDRNVSVELLEKALITYANQKHAVFFTYGRTQGREVNKRELVYLKMFRQTSALKILYDGFLLNTDVQYVEC